MKKKHIGGAFGLIFILLGAVITAAQFVLTSSDLVILTIFLIGPALIFSGITMLFFPGAEVIVPVDSAHATDWYTKAPTLHRTIWISAMVAGVIIGIVLF